MARVTVSVHCPLPLYEAVEEYVESDDSPEDATLSNTFARLTDQGLPPEYRTDLDHGHQQDSPLKDAMIETLAERGPMHREELADAIDRPLDQTATHLTRLRQQGLVSPEGGGVWSTTVEEKSPTQE